MHPPARISHKWKPGLLVVLAPLPALLVGVMVMRQNGVSPGIWAQQLAAGLTLIAICAALSVGPRLCRPLQFPRREISVVVLLLLLAGTLAQPGLEGVRRWVPLGPVQLHAAFMVIPILLVLLAGVLKSDQIRTAAWPIPFATTVAAIVLLLQPDPSQASAFGVAIVVLLLLRSSRSRIDWLSAGIILLAASVAWTRPDPLVPVSYVEGIIGLAGNLGVVWVVASVLALAFLPIPFIAYAFSDSPRNRTSLAVAVYFLVVSCMPMLGPYPVPILGYGISPMLGYFAALCWLVVKSPGSSDCDQSFGSS